MLSKIQSFCAEVSGKTEAELLSGLIGVTRMLMLIGLLKYLSTMTTSTTATTATTSTTTTCRIDVRCLPEMLRARARKKKQICGGGKKNFCDRDVIRLFVDFYRYFYNEITADVFVLYKFITNENFT